MLSFPDSTISRVLAHVRQRGSPAWLVGGTVRDYFLGRATHDLDIIVPEGGIRLARAIAGAFAGGFFVLDHERDVGRAVLRGDEGRPLYVDVARLRAPDLLDDLAQRDFTVNAIAVALQTGEAEPEVIDPFDGRGDVDRRLIRAVSEGAFDDDPLRMLRAVRLAAELGFNIESSTFNLVRRDASLLPRVASERIRDELMRIVTVSGAWRHLRLLSALDLLPFALPEVAALIGIAQSPPHYLDVFDHTRAVVAHMEGLIALLWPESHYVRPLPVAGDPVIMAAAGRWDDLAGLLDPYVVPLRSHLAQPLAAGHTRRDWLFWGALAHDWGKALTASTGPDGRIHFYGHEHESARLAAERAKGLSAAASEIDYLSWTVEYHMRPGHLAGHYPPTRRALYHLFRDAGNLSPDIALLTLADQMATHAPESPEAAPIGQADLAPGGWRWEDQLGVAGLILGNYFSPGGRAPDDRVLANPRPLLDGTRLMAEFGLSPGPLVGRLIAALREAQAIGEVTTVDEARTWLNTHLDEIRTNKTGE